MTKNCGLKVSDVTLYFTDNQHRLGKDSFYVIAEDKHNVEYCVYYKLSDIDEDNMEKSNWENATCIQKKEHLCFSKTIYDASVNTEEKPIYFN